MSRPDTWVPLEAIDEESRELFRQQSKDFGRTVYIDGVPHYLVFDGTSLYDPLEPTDRRRIDENVVLFVPGSSVLSEEYSH